jgi:hypothetical protein
MAYEDIRDYLVGKLQALLVDEESDPIAQVHGYFRLVKQWKDAQSVYAVDGKLNVWFVRLSGTQTLWHGHDVLHVVHTVHLEGFRGVEDAEASEQLFSEQVQSVLEDFFDDHDLGGECLTSDPPSLIKFEQTMLGAMLCHSAVISLTVYERRINT